MRDYLILALDGPLQAWGGEVIDSRGVIRRFPGRSGVTGLLANALGWDRAEGARHDALQARIRSAALRLREAQALQDFQTAQLGKSAVADKGWTTRGRREERAGGAGTYDSPHIRLRDWEADQAVLLALRLEAAEDGPDLPALAAALTRPARPLFLGRKPAIPSGPLLAGRIEAATGVEAMRGFLGRDAAWARRLRASRGEAEAQWDPGEGPDDAPGLRAEDLCDERRWALGVHGGLRQVMTGRIAITPAKEAA